MSKKYIVRRFSDGKAEPYVIEFPYDDHSMVSQRSFAWKLFEDQKSFPHARHVELAIAEETVIWEFKRSEP